MFRLLYNSDCTSEVLVQGELNQKVSLEEVSLGFLKELKRIQFARINEWESTMDTE